MEENIDYSDVNDRGVIITEIINQAKEKKLPLNIITLSAKNNASFNEFSFIGESMQILALKILSQTLVLGCFEVADGNSVKLYESCYNAFNDYIENDNANVHYGEYEDYVTFDMIFGTTSEECISSLIETFKNFSKEGVLYDAFLSQQELLLCMLIINGCLFAYSDEIDFYYAENRSPNVNF